MASTKRVHLQVESSQVIASGISDPGCVRPENEDSIWLDKAGNFVLLADGMGGHERGAEASSTSINVIRPYLNSAGMFADVEEITGGSGVPPEIVCVWSVVDEAVDKATGVLFERNQELQLQRFMGTTIVGLVMVQGDYVLWFHVGDSRLYLWRQSTLKRLTVDHSAHSEWVSNGRSGEEPGKNVITRAIGPHAAVVADIGWDERQKDDIFVLCSDGLSDMISEEEIEHILRDGTDVDHIAIRLIDAANDAGGKDNVSVIVCKT